MQFCDGMWRKMCYWFFCRKVKLVEALGSGCYHYPSASGWSWCTAVWWQINWEGGEDGVTTLLLHLEGSRCGDDYSLSDHATHPKYVVFKGCSCTLWSLHSDTIIPPKCPWLEAQWIVMLLGLRLSFWMTKYKKCSCFNVGRMYNCLTLCKTVRLCFSLCVFEAILLEGSISYDWPMLEVIFHAFPTKSNL